MRIKFRHLLSTLDVLSEPEDNPSFIDDAAFQASVRDLSSQYDALTERGDIDPDDVIVEII
jgi:hypothetical protein